MNDRIKYVNFKILQFILYDGKYIRFKKDKISIKRSI